MAYIDILRNSEFADQVLHLDSVELEEGQTSLVRSVGSWLQVGPKYRAFGAAVEHDSAYKVRQRPISFN